MNVDGYLRTQRILFIALLLTVPMYAAVATLMAQTSQEPPGMPELAREPFAQPMVLALIVGSIITIGLALFTRTKMFPPRRRGDGARDPKVALARLRVAEILTWALCESIAIYGLILSVLSLEPVFSYAFGGASALAMLLFAPSRKLAEEVVWAASE